MDCEPSDIVIIGGGPAGATAATLLAQQDRHVTLVEKNAHPGAAVCSGWLNARAMPLLIEMGIPPDPITAGAFNDITFYTADFSKTATPTFEGSPGFLVDRPVLEGMMLDAARAAGTTVLQGREATDIQLNETSVVVTLDDQTQRESRLAILAAGRGTDLLSRVGLAHDRAHKPTWCAQAAKPITAPGVDQGGSVTLVLGLDTHGSFGLCCTSPHNVSVSLHWMGEPDEVRTALVNLCQQAAQHGIISVDLTKTAAAAPLIPSPASAALDMESHVAKHTLVIGDAGGFVSAASDEGIYPAMWSAQIAAEVINEALDEAHKGGSSQDVLMTFDSRWRLQMADYLRSPHTDIQFLLPLIFSNQPMANRMGAAFFSGENI